MNRFTVNLTYDRSTKNTYLYRATNDTAPISAQYIAKSAFEEGNPPKRLRIIVEEDPNG